jgi:homoserine kinase type II
MSAESYVLTRFLRTSPDSLVRLGSAGGFSGASIWKVGTPSGSWCLKAWPAETPRERLERIHSWMAQARDAGLRFVPAIAAAVDGATIVEANGRLWDLSEWMPGRADFHSRPTETRMEAACVAIAKLHQVWRAGTHAVGEPTSITRRLQVVAEWQSLITSGWVPRFTASSFDPVTVPARAVWDLLSQLVPTVGQALAAWVGRPLPLHPCLCDIWGDHVLFTGDEVTGVIDYGSMRIDHPAADLARLLGDLVGNSQALNDAGLSAYGRFAPLSSNDALLVRALDQTGTILAAVRWLTRLYHDRESFGDRERVAARLRLIVDRISHSGHRF